MAAFIQGIINVINTIAGFAFILAIPLAIFRKTRLYAGYAFYGVALINGFWLWILCLVTVLEVSLLLTIVGVIFFGVGVVPIALILMAIQGEWASFIVIFAIGLGIWITRMAGSALISKSEYDTEQALIE